VPLRGVRHYHGRRLTILLLGKINLLLMCGSYVPYFVWG
jgi:hypothetical protein